MSIWWIHYYFNFHEIIFLGKIMRASHSFQHLCFPCEIIFGWIWKNHLVDADRLYLFVPILERSASSLVSSWIFPILFTNMPHCQNGFDDNNDSLCWNTWMLRIGIDLFLLKIWKLTDFVFSHHNIYTLVCADALWQFARIHVKLISR